MIDEHFRLTQADGDVFGMEAPLRCSLVNDNLEKFLEDWEYWLSCAQKRPEGGMLEALFLRQLRKCTHLQDELRDYDRLSLTDERRGYEGLLGITRRHLERVRMQKHRDSMTTAIAGGNALASVSQNKNKKGGKGKGKGKEGGKAKDSDGSQSQHAADPMKGICRMHLKGKCRAGNSCNQT